MFTTTVNSDLTVRDFVNETMLLIDASAPKSAQLMSQRFWLADPLVSVAVDISNELIDSLEDRLIRAFPFQIFFPGFIGP